jgi:hypothetical protein
MLCKSNFHIPRFFKFAKVNSAVHDFGVEFTFSNEVTPHDIGKSCLIID